ncbi:hypothetical protein EON65_10835 [archaeon]|nr:MAG: hypothetical protein EON65_10835 [archaeon]
MLLSYSWKSATLFRRQITSRQRLLYSATYQDIEQICKSSGPKPTFQELCQNVFQGKYPVYNWSSEALEVVVPNILRETFTIDLPANEVLTNARKKEEENKASAELIRGLFFSPVYRPIVTSYFSQRLNKDNPPLLFTRNDMLALLKFKSVAILVDVENVGDMRKYFFVTKTGDIKCLCPPAPQLYAPPANFDSKADEAKTSIPIGYAQSFSDEEMLVLGYAHDAAGNQGAMANRVTYSEHKDAADGKYILHTVCLVFHMCM